MDHALACGRDILIAKNEDVPALLAERSVSCSTRQGAALGGSENDGANSEAQRFRHQCLAT